MSKGTVVTPHLLDPRSGLVLDTRDLSRRPGVMKEITRVAEAPSDLGIEVIGVPPGSPIEFDLRLESVVEGVLVTGSAKVQLRGSCTRCLEEIASSEEIDIQELFCYPGKELGDEEASRIEGDLIDLEPVLRDAVVLDLPFTPLCRPDCAGLCPDCGANLNADPDHIHDESIDPRWTSLAEWTQEQTTKNKE
ncbi:YceD family protein [Propionicimonas sp.]|uniref:YceD family protein n=1 Tax=Propionicimonas sp. TaxID=1955623 RepID=UPI0017B0EF27|nr:YceD family protein [Propionicimonas sp.]MBU3976200.1 DUF177 domain-containing protein [Actinomycetota bacterium]MBA3021012.1 DUF177 domain-containing protein [Propionicimonas sp.]MBU3985595.1 DUF177 domain-containing protein [Actinomycetota bacterium]MBU4008380.1 DUF177 domain-containing protein [Actinomycetota bacterium]MBU4066470.1 DUF177 domain-containing protein [Actinomycetota bacterium]